MTRKLTITVVLGIALMLGVQSGLARTPDMASIQAREKALGRDFQLGDFAVNNTWTGAVAAKPSMYQAREKALGRDFQLGDFAVNNTWTGKTGSSESRYLDDRGDIDQSKWPTVGIGLGVGLMLILGFGLALKATHTRPFAH
jgi:hypothetical protein